ncbi:outer membrane transport energization protein ExbD [Rhodovulum bhavnagarense]|uniref:Outer membrane transport energization protein ExbD n=1 Tax=Rhodovulum bhavnagarense TaxID=992286 RepID=A0A4R2RMF6_9RHOB|nr:biopolymer transporter ExbD [Rhodovulum bhavnagarense]TCP60931.1 outer membrane transport energization protein ExbD [Rhodovulum bhavnagarense]
MRLPQPARRPARESVVPMINVVFLLLVFFMISAQLAPPDPFEVTPPAATSDDPAQGAAVLHVAQDGALAYGAVRGEAALAALAEAEIDGPLMIRADKAAPGQVIAALIARLSAAGIGPLELIAEGG